MTVIRAGTIMACKSEKDNNEKIFDKGHANPYTVYIMKVLYHVVQRTGK